MDRLRHGEQARIIALMLVDHLDGLAPGWRKTQQQLAALDR